MIPIAFIPAVGPIEPLILLANLAILVGAIALVVRFRRRSPGGRALRDLAEENRRLRSELDRINPREYPR